VPNAGAVSLAVLEPAPRVLRHWPPEDPSSDHALRRVSVSGGVATAAAPVSGSTAGAVASGIAAFDLSSRSGWGGGVELGFIQARRASSVVQALEVWASHQWLTLYGRVAWKPWQRLGIDATFGPRFTRVVYGKPETFDVRVGVAASVGLSTPLWWRLSATLRGTGVLSLDPTSAWPSVAEGKSPGTRVLLGNLTLGLALEW
ncbi:MAG: hypothetical protein JNG84_02765, partial [Archangium sp.]|nr:hypothetical protein [Archangium sp.]